MTTHERGRKLRFTDEVDHGTARIELAEVTKTIEYDRRGYDREKLAIEVDE